MPIILMIMIFTAMISAGVLLIGPMTKRGKTVDTQKTVDGAISSIISWSIANNRIPDVTALPSATGFLSVAGNPKDAYGNSLVYIYDSNLTSPSTGGICGRQSTNLRVSPVTDNIAFVVISGGEDGVINSTPNTSQAYGATVTVSPNDLVKWITLEELKTKAGCYGTTQGRLRIINNELPKFCAGGIYQATVYAEGGVPFAGGQYQWCIQGALPMGITANPNAICPVWSGNAANIQLSATNVTGASQTVTFMVQDNNANTAQRNLPISIKSCSPPPGAQISFADNLGNFKNVNPPGTNNVTTNSAAKTAILDGNQTGANGWGCLWYPVSVVLKDKVIRSYFRFSFLFNEANTRSRTYADGFTFTLIESPANLVNVQNGNVCGGYGPYMGYANDGLLRATPYILGNSVAMEFDVYPNNATYAPNLRDPATFENHAAIVKDASNTHAGANPVCPSAGCNYSPGNVRWLEDNNAVLHNARIEVITGYSDSTCTTIIVGGSYALLKGWIDCAACDDLTTNYAATLPILTHCFAPSASMDNVLFGFTAGTSTNPQGVEISNFGIGSY